MDNFFHFVIATGVVGVLLKFWADTKIEKHRAEYQEALERLRHELVISNSRSSRYYESQFLTYSEIWEKLQSVKSLADDLWIDQSNEKLDLFAQKLLETKGLIIGKSLFLEEHQYSEINTLLEKFSRYDNTQFALIDFYKHGRVDDVALERYFEGKEKLIQEYTELLEQVRASFRSQLQIR